MAGIWAQNTTTKAWTRSGATGTRTVMVAPEEWPGDRELVLQLTSRAHKVAAFLPGSKHGDTGWRVGIDDTTDTLVTICPVVFGVIGVPIVTVAGDTPSAAPASAAHGVAASTPLTLRIRFHKGVMELRVNDVLKLSWSVAGDGDYAHYRHYGFESKVQDAVVSRARLCTLVPTEPIGQAEVLIPVCDGNVLYSVNGGQIGVLAKAQFQPTGPVCLFEHQGFVYGLDSVNVRKISPQLLTSVAWTAATAGTFPGSALTPVAGKSRMTIGYSTGARAGVAGDRTDAQNLFESAIDDTEDWDTGDPDAPGRAFGTTTGLSGKIGQPIKCVCVAPGNVRYVGCTGSIYRVVGDLVFGPPEITPVSLQFGVSGKDSMILADGGTVIGHGPQGAFIIVAGQYMPLSDGVLTTGINLERRLIDNYLVQVIRDPKRKHTHFFLTPKDGTQGTHYAYDERTGKFMPGQGGFFPDTYPASMGPTASCIYQGELVLGTHDGQLMVFNDTLQTDDGTPVDFKFNALLMDPKDKVDICLDGLSVMLGAGSSNLDFRVYEGFTPEAAMTAATRALRYSGTASASTPGFTFTQKARGRAIAVEFSNNVAGRVFVEQITAEFTIDEPMTFAQPVEIPAPGGPCPPPTITPPATPDGDGPGAGVATIEYILEQAYAQEALAASTNFDTWQLIAAGGDGPDRGVKGGPGGGVGGSSTSV